MAGKIFLVFDKFFSNPLLAGIIISALPLIELRGGMPYVYYRLGGGGFFNLSRAFACSFIGSSAVILPLLLLFIPVLSLLKKSKLTSNAANKIERRFLKKSKRYELERGSALDIEIFKKNIKNRRLKYTGLFVFSLLPVPLTGVWSASALAAVMGLDIGKSLFWIMLGNFCCGLLIGAICLSFSVFI